MAIKIERGNYTGDGIAPRTITLADATLDPKVIFVRARAAVAPVHWWPKGLVSSLRFSYTLGFDAFAPATVLGVPFGAGFFTVYNNIGVNAAGIEYDYMVLDGVNGGADGFFVGQYTGTSVQQDITGLGFQPDLVIIKAQAGGALFDCVFKTSEMTVNESYQFQRVVAETNSILDLLADGFRVGPNIRVNFDGLFQSFFALKKSAGIYDSGTYIGNETVRNIDNLSLEPISVWIEAKDRQWAQGRMDGQIRGATVDETFEMGDVDLEVDRIRRLLPSGFQLGEDRVVNEDGITFFFMIWGVPITAPQAKAVAATVALGVVGVPLRNFRRVDVASASALGVVAIPTKQAFLPPPVPQAVASTVSLTVFSTQVKAIVNLIDKAVVATVAMASVGIPIKVITNQLSKAVAGTVAIGSAGVAAKVAFTPTAQKAVATTITLNVLGTEAASRKERAPIPMEITLAVIGAVVKEVFLPAPIPKAVVAAVALTSVGVPVKAVVNLIDKAVAATVAIASAGVSVKAITNQLSKAVVATIAIRSNSANSKVGIIPLQQKFVTGTIAITTGTVPSQATVAATNRWVRVLTDQDLA